MVGDLTSAGSGIVPSVHLSVGGIPMPTDILPYAVLCGILIIGAIGGIWASRKRTELRMERYNDEELESLREYMGDQTIGHRVEGRYMLGGRIAHDLWMVPVHITMDYGPRNRILNIADDILVLRNVGDSWQEATYKRLP
jgi:hypothetical protein